MKTLRQELHAVATEFADRLYELVRKGLLEELGGLLGSPPRHEGGAKPSSLREDHRPSPRGERAAARREPKGAAAEDFVERVASWVREHPGSRSGELLDGLGITKGALTKALAAARERGLVRIEGNRGQARYFPVRVPSRTPLPRPTVRARKGGNANGKASPLPSESPADVVKLLKELDEALAAKMHPMRLGRLMRALVAEIRELLERHPRDRAMTTRLEQALGRIRSASAEHELPYIFGLKRSAVGDWSTLARKARARVAAFDTDTGAARKLNGSKSAG